MFTAPENYGSGEAQPSLPGFIDWLRSKDPNERYEWPNSYICACGQYARSLGRESWGPGLSTWSQLNMIARGRTEDPHGESDPEDWTFGKCLERAERAARRVLEEV